MPNNDTTSHKPKVFGIGLSKTGTSTLGQCGKILGFRCKSSDRELLINAVTQKDFDKIHETIAQFDLFEDWPWPLIYKELDKAYPGSKFILTVRHSVDSWYKSLLHQSMKTSPRKHCRLLAYGYNYPHKWKKEHVEFYNRHNAEAREYFAGRDNDFIEVCWENGDGMEKICDFLGVKAPNCELPHANKSATNKPRLRRLLANKFLSAIYTK